MRRGIRAVAAFGAILLAVGCSASNQGSNTTDDVLKIAAVIDETGAGGFAGAPSRRGIELAVEQINAAGGVHGKPIEISFSDSATNSAQATSLVTQAANDSSVDAIIYGVIGSSAVGLTPVAQRERVPLVLLQATVREAMEAGDFIFRISYAQTDYYANVIDYWEDLGIKSISVIAHEDNASGMQIVNEYFIPTAKERGFTVYGPHLARSSDTDYTRQAQDIVAENPDAVYAQLLGTPIVTLVTQLRNLGYEGLIGASVGSAGGVIAPLGELANGIVYPNSFTADTDLPSGIAFVKAYEEKYGEKPNNFAADGYDAVRLLAAAAEKAGPGFTRETLQKAILAVTQEGLPGSPTDDPLRFKDRAGSGRGVLIRWQDGGETRVPLD